jgi:hypothetical protein
VKIRLSDLRRAIREAAGAIYGWPTDEVEHVYGVPDRMADTHPTDMGNLKLPKGPNSRDDAEDRPLEDDLNDDAAKPKPSYGKARGVSYNNKSNNDAGRHGMGGGG